MPSTRFRTTSVLIFVVAALVFASCSGPRSPASPGTAGAKSTPTPQCATAEESALMDQINATRTAAGKLPLPFDTRLMQAARQDAQQFAASGVKNFEFGGKYGYGGTSFVGGADAGFPSAADFWASEQRTAGTAITDPLTKDAPFEPRHIGVGNVDQTYALVLGSDPGPTMSSGSCDPG
jgi:hypothetical protein